MKNLDGKKIFVSGAAAGMGQCVAKLAALEGAEVFATDVSPDGLKALQKHDVKISTLDVTKPKDVQRYFANQPDFDGIVNMAGWVHHGNILQADENEWRKSFLINLDSMYFVIRAALPGLIKQRGGSIVNMASGASSIKGFAFRAAYGASKAAVIGLTKSVAVDFMADGVRCNAICPGTIETPSWQERMEEMAKKLGSEEEARAWFVKRQPMGRLGQAEEIAPLVMYLLSDSGAYATGQPFIVDGGTMA